MEMIQIYDFGSQYTQLIARRVREQNVFCEILPYYEFPKLNEHVRGIILSGSPYSVLDEGSPFIEFSKVLGHIPMLGVCYGAQLYAHLQGGAVSKSIAREYGRATLNAIQTHPLMLNVSEGTQVWMSHGDAIEKLPEGSKVICSTHDIPVAGYADDSKKYFGLQFHPEVFHSQQGKEILHNFVVTICGLSQSWTPESFVESTVQELKQQLNNHKVLIGLSGGVDSTVAARLLHKAIGNDLYCVFVDNGLLRKNEYELVLESYHGMGLQVIGVQAEDEFLDALSGVSDPETKRKIIGTTFIKIFEREAKKLQNIEYLAQGTIYPDVIESISVKGPSATIKSHHNVGGLPEKMNLKVVEPLRFLFKDEVRKAGAALGIPGNILNRHPFPGPGLAIRIIGDLTKEKLNLLKEADHIFIEGLKTHDLYHKVWQAFVVLLPVQSVGVMGDERTYENVVALRAVGSTDGMTADWSHLPYEFLARISNDIINKIPGINRVVYDISSKPPATIEWE
jgi:GMP synthase (glutamine-hydrolysing)